MQYPNLGRMSLPLAMVPRGEISTKMKDMATRRLDGTEKIQEDLPNRSPFEGFRVAHMWSFGAGVFTYYTYIDVYICTLSFGRGSSCTNVMFHYLRAILSKSK